jgi:hypothetical protein
MPTPVKNFTAIFADNFAIELLTAERENFTFHFKTVDDLIERSQRENFLISYSH